MILNEELFESTLDEQYTIYAYELNNSTNRMNKTKVGTRNTIGAAEEFAQIIAERISDVMGRNYVTIVDSDGDEIDTFSGPYNSDVNPNIDDLKEAIITMSRAEMNRLDREVEDARKEVAKYNIPMKAQMNSAGETEAVPDFEVVPENQRDAAKAAHDRYQKALQARPDRAKNIIKYTEDELTEGAFKDLAFDIEEAGGKENWLKQMRSKISECKEMLDYLKNIAPREVNRGGAYDSYEEISEALTEIEMALKELEAQEAIVSQVA